MDGAYLPHLTLAPSSEFRLKITYYASPTAEEVALLQLLEDKGFLPKFDIQVGEGSSTDFTSKPESPTALLPNAPSYNSLAVAKL